VVVTIDGQISNRVRDPVRRDTLVDNAPGIVALLLIGFLFVFRGRRWTTRLTERLQARTRSRGRTAVAFLVSLLQITVPLAGVLLLLAAVVSSGMVGPQTTAILESLAGLAVAVYVSLWLAGRLFRDDPEAPFALLRATPERAAAARRVTVSIGVTVGMAVVMETLTGSIRSRRPPMASCNCPSTRCLRISSGASRGFSGPTSPNADPKSFRVLRARRDDHCQRACGLAVVGPLLAAIGYVNAAEAAMVPAALSLALIGFLLALQPVVRDLYAVIFRTTPEESREALLPVLIDFLLVFAALPLFALIWGARTDDLGEVYARFWEGLTIGEARITPSSILAVAVIFGLGMLATRLLQGALKSTVLPRTRLDSGAQTAVISGIGYLGIGLAAVIAITAGGIDLTALGVLIGALSVGIGFGLQNVVNNFVSGIILLIERPISEGDWIEVNGNMGIVKDISVRSTRIETFDKHRCHRAQRRFHLGHRDELDPRQHRGPGHPHGRRGLWHRHAAGAADPDRDRP
jgi:potassium efflux system protein